MSPRLKLFFYARSVFLDRDGEKTILAEIKDLTAEDNFLALFLDQQGEKVTCTLKTRVLNI